MLQLRGFGVVVDDIIDKSEMRGDQPCWYRNEDVGVSAVNDSTMLENATYSILKKYFSNTPSYIPLLHLFHEVAMKSAMGKSLDSSITNGVDQI